MLDILEVAREKGIQEGKAMGIQEGKLETSRNILLKAISDHFGSVPPGMIERIGGIQDPEALQSLLLKVYKCDTIQAFEQNL